MDNIEFEAITVTLPELKVWFREAPIHFTLTELRLLLVFLSDPYRTFSTEELVERMELNSHSACATLVSRVRTLLDQSYILSVPGHGYAFAMRRN